MLEIASAENRRLVMTEYGGALCNKNFSSFDS